MSTNKCLMIIPAAGKGTRLKSAVPKLLHPVGGHAMIDYLIRRYAEFADRFVLIIHPSAHDAVQAHLKQFPIHYTLRYQHKATGMLDAIMQACVDVERYRPDHIWVSWCDQIAISTHTARKLARKLADLGTIDGLVFPTINKPDPYIHFARNERGEIVSVLQKREGDSMPPTGENDSGLFGMTYGTYTRHLRHFAKIRQQSQGTGEQNFLPFIPWLKGIAPVVTFPVTNPAEAIGVNNEQDAQAVADFLEPIS